LFHKENLLQMKTYTKETLIKALCDIRDMGWIRNARPGNAGGIGNTVEDLLGIEENNLPLPNAADWELKCQRAKSSSLTTLFHMEPSPRACKIVPSILLPKYGWKHKEAGKKHPKDEMSFRQTINGLKRTDRGFGIEVDRSEGKILISFDFNFVGEHHLEWLKCVDDRVGLNELDPQPYWGFSDLFHKAGTKLRNTFYLRAETKRERKIEYFHYSEIMILQDFRIDNFVKGIEKGYVLIDFDARTDHNHGTKFRLRKDKLPDLYRNVKKI
jgi:hypothetical protein